MDMGIIIRVIDSFHRNNILYFDSLLIHVLCALIIFDLLVRIEGSHFGDS